MLDRVFESIRSVIKGELDGFRSKEEYVEEFEGEPELILLYHPECPACKDWLEAFQEMIDEGVIKKVSINSVHGMQIAHKIGDFSIPQLIVKIGKNYNKCDVRVEGDDLVFDCDFEELKKN